MPHRHLQTSFRRLSTSWTPRQTKSRANHSLRSVSLELALVCLAWLGVPCAALSCHERVALGSSTSCLTTCTALDAAQLRLASRLRAELRDLGFTPVDVDTAIEEVTMARSAPTNRTTAGFNTTVPRVLVALTAASPCWQLGTDKSTSEYLDWLCLHVDEHSLPAAFAAHQFEVGGAQPRRPPCAEQRSGAGLLRSVRYAGGGRTPTPSARTRPRRPGAPQRRDQAGEDTHPLESHRPRGVVWPMQPVWLVWLVWPCVAYAALCGLCIRCGLCSLCGLSVPQLRRAGGVLFGARC